MEGGRRVFDQAIAALIGIASKIVADCVLPVTFFAYDAVLNATWARGASPDLSAKIGPAIE
jgi:hypothetical protein